MVGFSLKTNSAPSRAPAASITADSMRRDVSLNSRSAVSSGPSSERASTVRNSLRKLFVSTAKVFMGKTLGRLRLTCTRASARTLLLVSLVRSEKSWNGVINENSSYDPTRNARATPRTGPQSASVAAAQPHLLPHAQESRYFREAQTPHVTPRPAPD